MACHAIHSWTFCGLVGAFLDLALAYLLLCGSTLAFFASKFLGFFGMHLPCPCNGFFSDPNGGKCLQRLLVDCPTGRICSVHMSVKSKFPFDSIWTVDQGCHLKVKLVRDGGCSDGVVEMEGEASCSSFPEVRRSQNLAMRDAPPDNEVIGIGLINSPAVHEGGSDVKGKGILNQKPRSGLRRRRRRAAVGYGGFSSVSSANPPQSIVQGIPHSPCSVSEIGNEATEESSVSVNSGDDHQYHEEAPTGISLGERALHRFDLNGSLGESKSMEKDASFIEEFVRNARGELVFDGNEANVIRVLEQALKEEHTARAALYLELEKERSAAATAADEAMGMILRLQKDKALIEMEAWQYQRMIEEKSAYDAEEMNILKEIIVRREREKHVLENEVETYRQMMRLGNEQLDGDVHDIADTSGQRPTYSLNSSEDPVLMLQQIHETIRKKELVEHAIRSSNYEVTSVEKEGCTIAFGNDLRSPDWDEDANFLKQGDIHNCVSIDKHHPCGPEFEAECGQVFQEKGMVFTDENPSALKGEGKRVEANSMLYNSSSPQGQNFLGKTAILVGEKQEHNIRLCNGTATKKAQTQNETGINFPCDGEDLEKLGKDADPGGTEPHSSVSDIGQLVYDVHVIDDKSKPCKEESGKERERLLMDAAFDRPRKHGLLFEASGVQSIDVLTDRPSKSRAETDPEIHRSSSDMTSGLPPMGNQRGKALPFILRRNSMSAVDNERMKIDTEVGWLRERLRIVQEGREKLSFSVEHREGEKMQLQLLEDIANQLREIRQQTEPGKAVRQVSLPPLSSKFFFFIMIKMIDLDFKLLSARRKDAVEAFLGDSTEAPKSCMRVTDTTTTTYEVAMLLSRYGKYHQPAYAENFSTRKSRGDVVNQSVW
ncbi:hypothetical protein HHK36_013049 [Tetracentron sinense]|uniref:GTD-binding domain-containing protein n=1 Tax=Tetracentron sinense TaxID=13715 RepID=A0A834ZGE0_TETSI|nr:hypothetical protein HHK36_013049 [Tetracentron sinense]